MSAPLERIVRPFQAGNVFSARVIVPSLPASGVNVSADVPRLEWTGENPADFDSMPDEMIYHNFTVEWQEDGDKRVTETVRIEQEGKPENYVEVERVQQATMTDEQTGKTFTLKFADWARGRS